MKRLVDDELWELVEELLPPEPEKPKGGRPRLPSRAALEGIVYVLGSGIPWRMLPQQASQLKKPKRNVHPIHKECRSFHLVPLDVEIVALRCTLTSSQSAFLL